MEKEIVVHSMYSPSSAKRWMACSKSLLSSLVAQDTNEQAQKGTDIHDEIERFLLSYASLRCDAEKAQAEGADYDFTLEGFIDEVKRAVGLSRHAEKMLKELHSLVDLNEGVGEIESKQFFVDGFSEAFGYVDYIQRKETENEIWVIDYKTGMLEVKAKGNEQLLCYAAAEKPFNENTVYKLVILQMSEFDKEVTVDLAEYSAAEIAEFKDKVAQAIAKVREGEIEEVAGEHCTFCRIKANCKAITRYMLKGEQELKSDEFNRMDLLIRVRTAKNLEKLAKVTIDEVKGILDAGKEITGVGYKLQKHGITWDEYAEPQLFELLGDRIYKQELKTPTELKEAIGNEFAYVPEELYTVQMRRILTIEKE